MISYVKCTLSLFSALLLAVLNLSAKETLCYKLVETTDPTVKVGGYQFISFIGDQCYESSHDGIKIHDGKLNRNSYQSSMTKTVYTGTCFCGGGSKFEFTSNRSVLMVFSKAKHTYKFIKTSSPHSIKTCAYIRIEESGPVDSYNVNNVSGYNNISPYNSTSDSHYNDISNQTGQRTSQPTKRKCAYCNGTGRIEKNDNAPANFGTDRPRQRCNECGKWYDPDVFTHYHQQCRHCGGTGYAK